MFLNQTSQVQLKNKEKGRMLRPVSFYPDVMVAITSATLTILIP